MVPQAVTDPPAESGSVDLYWLPLGAGDHVVKHCGRAYEAIVAAREHRQRCDLYHAALEVTVEPNRWVIESAPSWDRAHPDRGVVAEGPVGARWLGRSRWFRYEVRCWRDGVIPDAAAAVDSPRPLGTSGPRAQRILDLAPAFPTLTWGRDELGIGDMWNSNSLIAWLLVHSGHDLDDVRPPDGGRAPGWRSGALADAAVPPVAHHAGQAGRTAHPGPR